MIKGGGAALLWERIVADAADFYVVVADSSKLKDRLGAFPLPIEVVQHGWESTTRSIRRLLTLHGYPADVALVRRVDDAGAPVVTDSGNFIVDAHLRAIPDPLAVDRELNWIPGVVENGLFTGLADEVIFSDADGTITVMECRDSPAGRPSTTPHGRRTPPRGAQAAPSATSRATAGARHVRDVSARAGEAVPAAAPPARPEPQALISPCGSRTNFLATPESKSA